jgi:hypothetical protein
LRHITLIVLGRLLKETTHENLEKTESRRNPSWHGNQLLRLRRTAEVKRFCRT